MIFSTDQSCNCILDGPLESIAIELTTRCNLHCGMCRLWKRQVKDPSFKLVTSLLRDAHNLGARRFNPYGTELFIRKDTPDILEYAERIGFHEIYIVSNGLLVNHSDLLDRLAALKSLVLIVSLDGPRDVHDKIRGRGVFDQAVSSLRQLGQKGIKTSIASIIMRPTIGRLHEVVDVAAELKIPVISMQPYSRDVAGSECNHSDFEFRPEEKEMIFNQIKKLLKYAKKKKVVIYTENMLTHTSSYFFDAAKPFPARGCRVPSKTMVVDIYGHVYPCFAVPGEMGNVHETNLSEICGSDIRKYYMRLALEKKCPGCLMACADVEGFNEDKKIPGFYDLKKFHFLSRVRNIINTR